MEASVRIFMVMRKNQMVFTVFEMKYNSEKTVFQISCAIILRNAAFYETNSAHNKKGK